MCLQSNDPGVAAAATATASATEVVGPRVQQDGDAVVLGCGGPAAATVGPRSFTTAVEPQFAAFADTVLVRM